MSRLFEKIEIPEIDLSETEKAIKNIWAEIDRIAKDIQEQKDNAIAMEFTKCIGELLRKNGVVPKISEYRMENHAENHTENKIEMRYRVNIDELDFSEHDKVFEDKIEDLQQRIRELIKEKDEYKRKCNNFGFENQDLKKIIKDYEDKIDELEKAVVNYKQAFEDKCKDYDFTSELLNKFGKENELLKQRIAELENENKNLNIRIFQNEAYGDKRPTKINLNDRIKVKLTPLGAEIYYHQYDELNKQIKENGGTELEPMMPQIDKDGYTEFQLHHFISLYGEHIGMCKQNVIEPLDIVIVE